MRSLIALLCLPIGFLGLAFGLNIGLGFDYVAVGSVGLGGVQESLAAVGADYGPWVTGAGVAAALIVLGFALNFIVSRFFDGPGFFTAFSGYVYGAIIAFIAFYLILMGVGVYGGTLTPDNSTLFFFFLQIPYMLAFENFGATPTGLILIGLGAFALLAAIGSAAHGDIDDDDT